ncbi:carbohydrate-binding protein [Streptomyces sp. M41]|uniref:carbohydrate-binding protein n=1 Tax=Streptomyces sp. M41 TaxID=3059412 RepID=UPI00374DEC99
MTYLNQAAGAPGAEQGAAVSTSIKVDGSQGGGTFDGVGAISGGGGNTRLLIDYPDKQRNEILDYLFKPGYGAQVQILKLEIGGDANTTDGSEPSFQHTKGDINCDAGYELWLAKEAKKRNPDIKLAGLAWAAPHWLKVNNANDFYAPKDGAFPTIDYLMDWMRCATDNELTIDYLGGWNERYPRGNADEWYKKLSATLKAKKYATKIVGGEHEWHIAEHMKKDRALRDAIDVMGVHYPCGYMSEAKSCVEHAKDRRAAYADSQELVKQGKTLWASENGSQPFDTGARQVARAINRGYIDSKMTAYINWPIVASLYQNLHFSKAGLLLADQPWSGAYDPGPTTWVMAHTAQFTNPGWKYIDSASGYLGGDAKNGSYVTLRSPEKNAYSAVIETVDAPAEQTATFTVQGGLPTGKVHVWATNLDKSAQPSDYFVQQEDITPMAGSGIAAKAGSFTIKLKPGYVYTVTSTERGGKGTATSPARAAFDKNHADDFEGYAGAKRGQQAKYLTAMNGAFEIGKCTGKNPNGQDRGGSCLRQEALGEPIRWTDEPYSDPYTLIGDADSEDKTYQSSWTDYTVSSDVMLEQAGHVDLLGRVGIQAKNNNGLAAYFLQLTDKGEWSIRRTVLDNKEKWKGMGTPLKAGTVGTLGLNTWHTMALTFQDDTITAKIDGKEVGTVTDTAHKAGQAGLGSGWGHVQYDNFKVSASSENAGATAGNGDGGRATSGGTNAGSSAGASAGGADAGTSAGATGGSCTVPAWDSSTTYIGGEVVSHNRSQWRANWWTQGNEPGGPTAWGAWEKIGTC